jgi:nicotinate phosphoribosyltransferase
MAKTILSNLLQAYLSKVARESFISVSKAFNVEWFAGLTVVASNDINEDTILSLNDQGHSIDVFGIGTHLGECSYLKNMLPPYIHTYIHTYVPVQDSISRILVPISYC